jgi:hypothetical protein
MIKSFVIKNHRFVLSILGSICLLIQFKLFQMMNENDRNNKILINYELLNYFSNFCFSSGVSIFIFGTLCIMYGSYLDKNINYYSEYYTKYYTDHKSNNDNNKEINNKANTYHKSNNDNNKEINNKANTDHKYRIHSYKYVNGSHIYDGIKEL